MRSRRAVLARPRPRRHGGRARRRSRVPDRGLRSHHGVARRHPDARDARFGADAVRRCVGGDPARRRPRRPRPGPRVRAGGRGDRPRGRARPRGPHRADAAPGRGRTGRGVAHPDDRDPRRRRRTGRARPGRHRAVPPAHGCPLPHARRSRCPPERFAGVGRIGDRDRDRGRVGGGDSRGGPAPPPAGSAFRLGHGRGLRHDHQPEPRARQRSAPAARHRRADVHHHGTVGALPPRRHAVAVRRGGVAARLG